MRSDLAIKLLETKQILSMIFCFNINAKYNNCIGGTSYYLKPKVDVLFIISCLNAYCRPDLRPLIVTSVMGATNSPPGGHPIFPPKKCAYLLHLYSIAFYN